MKTGKITAKLRDAVPVCLMVNGEEVKRYKNIELPDMLKEVEMTDFHFNVHMDGKITFEIHYEEGVLPEVFPGTRHINPVYSTLRLFLPSICFHRISRHKKSGSPNRCPNSPNSRKFLIPFFYLSLENNAMLSQ